MRRAAGKAEPAHLDDLPLDRETASLPDPAQALDDPVIADFLGHAAIFADHKLALMRVLDVGAGDECARGLDLMDQLVREQKIERPVDRRRPELATAAL